MNERLKFLRKSLHLSQNTLGKKLNISQAHVSALERGLKSITDRTISDYCRVFSINIHWLRTGEGEVFKPQDNTILTQLVNEYHLDELDKKIIEKFITLGNEERKIIKNYILSLLPKENG